MKRKHPFNMIEIMLALGVCAIGITSIMVLFPVGSAATRDAAMETYAAHAADQMLHFVKYQATNDWDTWVINNTEIPASMTPDAIPLADLADTTKWAYTDNAELGYGFYKSSTVANIGVYQLISARGLDPTDVIDSATDVPPVNSDTIDFRGLVFVWKEQISVNSFSVPYSMGVKFNIKVVWPAELPAPSRQDALYSLEVFKP